MTSRSTSEIDGIAAYAPATDTCYLVPIHEIEGRSTISLRLAPTRNMQAAGIRWAADYELARSLKRNWSGDRSSAASMQRAIT